MLFFVPSVYTVIISVFLELWYVELDLHGSESITDIVFRSIIDEETYSSNEVITAWYGP
jgi:hypothetical protein